MSDSEREGGRKGERTSRERERKEEKESTTGLPVS